MPSAETAASGRALLARRMAEAKDVVAGLPDRLEGLQTLSIDPPRCLVATGIGTSEGHARHLAEVAARFCGQPARFASTGSLGGGAPAGAEQDWLVVFSQGLSANARYALSHSDAFGGVLLVTGLSPQMSVADGLTPEKRAWLEDLEARGVLRVDLGCGAEYGALLRVIGARAGYAVGWSLLRALLDRRLQSCPALEIDPARLFRAQSLASEAVARAFPEEEPIAPFFDRGRHLLVVSQNGVTELSEQLTLKLAEGMLRPQPRALDVLSFAHGPLQSLAQEPTSILFLAADMPKHEGRSEIAEQAARDPSADKPWEGDEWLSRLQATLDPALHDLRVLRASLPWPFAALEFEAIFDRLVERSLSETDTDLVDWPGADREAALYAIGPNSLRPVRPRKITPRGARRLEEAVWPEVESLVRGGRRTALIGLGSIEQHGPHLPLGTDRFIADALLDGLVERLDDAVALPAIAIGCASEHLDFAGTLHVEPATLEAVLRDVLHSLARHGFERAFLFTAHGGNLDALGEMGDRLIAAARPIQLRIETDMRVGAMQSAIVEAASLSPLAAGPHAGEYETSLIAMIRPGVIRSEALAPGRVVEPGQAQGLFYPSLRPNTETGVLGDPSDASAARGPRYLAAWVDLLEVAYRTAFGGSSEKNRQ